MLTSNWSVPVLLKKGYKLTTFQNPTVVTPTLVDNGQYFMVGGTLYGNKFYYFYLSQLKCYNLDTNENTTITTTGETLDMQGYSTILSTDISISKDVFQRCMLIVAGTDGTYTHQTITQINLDTLVVSRYISTSILHQDVHNCAVERLGTIYNFGMPDSSTSFKWEIGSSDFISIPDLPFQLRGGFCQYNEITDEIVFIGGIAEQEPYVPDNIITFNPNTNEYVYKIGKSHLPQFYIKNGARINNTVYTVGGGNNKVYSFSLDRYTYSEIGLLPKIRTNATPFIYDNKLYYAGFTDDVGYTTDLSYGTLSFNCSETP